MILFLIRITVRVQELTAKGVLRSRSRTTWACSPEMMFGDSFVSLQHLVLSGMKTRGIVA
jgi:hypothetical protein